jgi:hypothetical protein
LPHKNVYSISSREKIVMYIRLLLQNIESTHALPSRHRLTFSDTRTAFLNYEWPYYITLTNFTKVILDPSDISI